MERRMKNNKIYERVSYTSNEIGSGKYCECGHELTYNEKRYKVIEHKCLNSVPTK